MFASLDNNNIEDVNNEISINKKIKVFVGYDNPFYRDYEQYGEIIWFPCGLFILTSANVSKGITGWTISVQARDKMALLDGTAGGTLPASIVFNENQVELEDGTIEIQHPTIYQIIYEAVNHWGGEPVENIVITDLDEKIKLLVKYKGDSPIYFSNNFESLNFVYSVDFPHMYTKGEDVGYQETDFIYPDELILQPGDTVAALLDKICNLLGNYEYFYDINGRFIFQQIKNYLNTGSPLTELQESDYTRSYSNAKYLYSLTNLDTTVAISKNPKFDQIKNDFIVWGKRKTSSDTEIDIRYHLAIDKKPEIDYAGKYMWAVKQNDILIRYDFNYSSSYKLSGYDTELISIPCDEWREELYRRALDAQVTNSVFNNAYDAELISEWRNLYDPQNEDWKEFNGWNPAIYKEPNTLNFWLDFIDSGAEIGKYSVNQIGRRTIAVNENNLTSVYNREVPDIIFIEGLKQDLIVQYSGIGQRYFILTPEYYDLFEVSSTGTSCFDRIREMLYQNLSYNTTIQLTCLPKYYMEPNNIIHIEDRDNSINGNYLITQYSLPLSYSGNMTITATEVLTRV